MSRPERAIVAILALLALGGGLLWGLRSQPPSETEIITRIAGEYVSETGGALTDCFARPSALEGVRLTVICEPEGGESWVRAVDEYGGTVAPDHLATRVEPQA